MIRNLDSLVEKVKDILEILMQRSHDDSHEHDYQMNAGTLTLEGIKYDIVIRLEQHKDIVEDSLSLYNELGYDTLNFHPIHHN